VHGGEEFVAELVEQLVDVDVGNGGCPWVIVAWSEC
jgi:hypothetical protein